MIILKDSFVTFFHIHTLDFSGVAPYLFIINALIFQGQLVRSFTCFLLLKQKLSLAPWTLSGLFNGACDTHRLNLSPLL